MDEECKQGETKLEEGINYVCVGGRWVPLPPTIRNPLPPVATVIVDSRDDAHAALDSKDLSAAIDSPDTQLVISVVPKPGAHG